MSYTNIRVTCPDGQRRHEGTFPTMTEAARWADYGHLCLAGHTFSADTIVEEAAA